MGATLALLGVYAALWAAYICGKQVEQKAWKDWLEQRGNR